MLKPTKHYLKQVINVKSTHNKTHGHHVPRMRVNQKNTHESYVIFAKNAKSQPNHKTNPNGEAFYKILTVLFTSFSQERQGKTEELSEIRRD